MKFGRRAFLQFAAGLVGGTLLTPLPWKLAGDSARWTQNWPWEPSPERGDITKVQSICLSCEGGCGIQARLVNGQRAILIEGNPHHPVNQGGICPLGASSLQYLYAPYRIPQPMKQTKKRGDATGFQPISWGEAVEELSGALGKLRAKGGPQGLAGISGRSRSSMYALWQQFFTAYGSPNLFAMPSELDNQKAVAYSLFGKSQPLAFALEKASYVLSFGANLLEGWGSPCRMQTVYRIWHEEEPEKLPVKLIQVEPRCSLTASKADEWVPVKPGAEAALALGIAHVLVRDNLYNADFAAQKFFGFEDWTDTQGKERQGFKSFVTAEYPPEKVAELTGVDKKRIEGLAKEFASHKDAVAVWGSDSGVGSEPFYHGLVFLTLNAMVGNIRPGGIVGLTPEVPLGGLPEPALDAIAQQGLGKPRLELAQSATVPIPGNGLHSFLDILSGNAPYPIDILMIHEANPAYSLPENQVFKKALEKVGMVVSFSPYMDETARMADLILPDQCALERYDDVIGLTGSLHGYYAVATPVLPPTKDVKHTGDVLLEVVNKMEGGAKESFPWKSYLDYLKERVKGLATTGKGAVADGATKGLWNLAPGNRPQLNYKDGNDLWTKLAKGMCWYDAPIDVWANMGTLSGDCEVACQVLHTRGVVSDESRVYLPHFAPLTPSGSEQEYPLLVASYRMLNIPAGFLPTTPFLYKTIGDNLLKGKDLLAEIHPQTARSLGFGEGDRAVLKTPQGEVPVLVHLYPGARPGMVFLAQGFGHTAYDEYIEGKGVNANNVIEVLIDPVTGQGTVWASRAQLRRA